MSFAIQGKMDYETLGKTGGISTTPGTPQWALAIKLKLQSVLKKSRFMFSCMTTFGPQFII